MGLTSVTPPRTVRTLLGNKKQNQMLPSAKPRVVAPRTLANGTTGCLFGRRGFVVVGKRKAPGKTRSKGGFRLVCRWSGETVLVRLSLGRKRGSGIVVGVEDISLVRKRKCCLVESVVSLVGG